MVFVKVVKNKAYYKRYQTKFRRRRECKTDYQQRRAMIIQDKNKYETPKYRFVVRITNRDIICQIFSAAIDHDQCICAAYSHELLRYGIKAGFANYASAYATGLLLARRIDRKFRLYFDGNKDINGEEYWVQKDESGMAPFKALLDIGLARNSAGARIFGALKGACDGGLDIPHNNKKKLPRIYPGSSKDEESKKWQYEADTHRKYIFGGHVAEYMKYLQENDPERYKKQFSHYIKFGINPDSIENIFAKAHALIRRDPFRARDPLTKGYFGRRTKAKDPKFVFPKKRFNKAKAPLESRINRIKQKLSAMKKEAFPFVEHYESKA